ncbi:hypothetical protein HJC23_000297 [Cyclotella cryptica]|uniref:RRM domain-containing protein n=1 Tax=Cyclotella cryptica TaxID=29204 RepID=A0ABD3NX70_9STRA
MSKGRKMSSDESSANQSENDDIPSDDENEEDSSNNQTSDEESENQEQNEQSSDEGDDDDDNSNSSKPEKPQQSSSDNHRDKEPKKKKIRKLKLDATQDFNQKLEKRGIVYLSRIPPRMGPSKIKSLLGEFGPVTRVYLAEEDKTVRKKRRKAGGSGFKRYTEGWVEFESKKTAKLVGETLNMTRVTNHKRSVHYDDLWNIKVAYERRVREQKLRVEMMEVRRENASYIAQVEAGKKLDYIEERRKRKGLDVGGNDEDDGAKSKKRKIRQKKPFEGDGNSTKSAILGSLV